MKKIIALLLTVLMTASLFAGCRSSAGPAASNSGSTTEEVVLTTENPTEKEEATIDPAETIHAEPAFPIEMTMEELEAKLGFGYALPNEDAYSGTIVSKFDDSLGENGGILLEYTFDDFTVYAMKYEENEIDAYDGWETEYAERGSEVINGVEVRFRGQSMVPDYRGVAFWKQNGYQYILNCETAPGTDIMAIIPLFMEDAITKSPRGNAPDGAGFPVEMAMEELEAKLGYGYMLPDESEYSGVIISMYDESLGENGGILLEYTFDDFTVYAMKYEENEIDAYDGWETEYAERGSEVINGVEVRFRGQSMVPDYRGVAFWKQNGYQYILNCETAPSTDIMSILPIFIENK